jgi:hypothetical protein
VWDEAENRLHVQKSVLVGLLAWWWDEIIFDEEFTWNLFKSCGLETKLEFTKVIILDTCRCIVKPNMLTLAGIQFATMP